MKQLFRYKKALEEKQKDIEAIKIKVAMSSKSNEEIISNLLLEGQVVKGSLEKLKKREDTLLYPNK